MFIVYFLNQIYMTGFLPDSSTIETYIFCITIGNVTSYCTMLCLTWGHIQIWSSYNFENIMCYWNLKVWVELYETIWEMYPCMSKVYYLFIQIIYFFGKLMNLKYAAKYFFTIFYHIYMLWWFLCGILWSKNFELSLQGNRIFHLSPGHGLKWDIAG